MAGLWANNPATPEGKYPVVLRRDGTQVDFPSFLISVHDPGFPAAMIAYAQAHQDLGSDPRYVADCRNMAHRAAANGFGDPPRPTDPDAPRHRVDDPYTIALARSGVDLPQFIRSTRLP